MNKILLDLGVVCAAIIVCYLISIVISSIAEVKGHPRTPMFLCDRHGAIPYKYVHHVSLEQITGDPVQQEICPLCFEARIAEAKARFKG